MPAEKPTDDTRIAVIVPCRNASPWLSELLDSVAGQTRPPDEVVVVDDGSDDDSFDVAESWQRSHVGRLPLRIVRQPSRGVAAALRRGMAETSAPFVARVDADDLLDPRYLEELEVALLGHPDAGYAYPAMRMFGTASGRYPVRPFDATQLVIAGNFVSSAALMRRSAYEATGGVADLPAWEDWDLWLGFLDAGWPGVFVDRELYFWRRHANSRNTMTTLQRRTLRLHIWWRHRSLVGRHLVRGVPVAIQRLRSPVRQQ